MELVGHRLDHIYIVDIHIHVYIYIYMCMYVDISQIRNSTVRINMKTIDLVRPSGDCGAS